MENLATESFSYSWLTQKPPLHNLGRVEPHDLDDFHFDVVTSPTHLVNADEIFSKGQIMAVYAADTSRTEATETSTSVPASPLSVPRNYPYYIIGKWRKRSKKMLLKCLGLVRRRRKSSSRVDDLERKVLEVGSFGNSVEASSPRHSSSSAVDNLGYDFEYCVKINDDENWSRRNNISRSPSPTASPSRSRSSYDCCDVDESSIHEAILYCKKSMHA